MESSSRIAAAIVIASVVLAGTYVSYREYSRQRDFSDLRAVAAQVYREVPALRRRTQRDITIQPVMPGSPLMLSHTLTDAQQCIEHVVVERHGSVFTQPLDVSGRPIVCYGRTSMAPVRKPPKKQR